MFRRVGKIPIGNTLNELVGMDFLDYGDFSTFLYIRDTFSRFSAIAFLGSEKKEQIAEIVRGIPMSNRLAAFGRQKFWWRAEIPGLLGKFFRNFVLLST